jgi:hypothetical protein
VTIRSWDEYMDALSELEPEDQAAARERIRDLVATDLQLQRFGVSYPHESPKQET